MTEKEIMEALVERYGGYSVKIIRGGEVLQGWHPGREGVAIRDIVEWSRVEEANAVDRIAQWLHDEVEWPDLAFHDRSWPLHDEDTGMREGGYIKLVEMDVVWQFRAIAERLLRSKLASTIPSEPEARYVLRLIADQRGSVAKDVAARAAAYEDWTEEVRASLDEAVEAFSERVAWECDDEIGDEENGEVDPAVLGAIASVWDTQAGAGPVGEAAFTYEWSPFGHEMWQPGVSLSDPLVYGGVRRYRNVRPLYAHPADEPGEVERLTRERDDALDRVEELEAEGERVSVEFEKDCWVAMRSLLEQCKFDWSNVDSEGVQAEEAREFISEFIKAADAALRWYEEQASAATRATNSSPPLIDAMQAILTVLSLDGGKRARAALSTQESSAALAGDEREEGR